MKFTFSQHADTVVKERQISQAWLEDAVFEPERTESDRMDPELEHRLRRIKEHGNRVLRVVIVKGTDPVRIVTAYFDRKMKDEL